MVVKELTRQLALSVSQTQSGDNCYDRRFADRMGNRSRQSELAWDLERTREEETHKRTRIVDGAQSVTTSHPARQR